MDTETALQLQEIVKAIKEGVAMIVGTVFMLFLINIFTRRFN